MLSNRACIFLPFLGELLNVKGKATRLNRIRMNSAGNIKQNRAGHGHSEAKCSSLLKSNHVDRGLKTLLL